MGRRLTDKGAYIRDAINTILGSATQPLSSTDLAGNDLLRDTEITATNVSEVLTKMFKAVKQPFPLKRIRISGPSNTRWAYYNPQVVQLLEDKPRGKKAAAPEPPPPPPAPPEFKFDPLPLTRELEEPTVNVPPGVKSITVRVGGVSIHIELQGA